MNLRCYRRRHVCTEWPEIGGAIVTGREQHGFVTVAYSQTDTPEGSTGPAAESDIYDCLIKTVFFNSVMTTNTASVSLQHNSAAT